VEHVLFSFLSWGYYVDVVPIAGAPGPYRAGIAKLRKAGHIIRELSVRSPHGASFTSVFRLDIPIDPDLLDEDGALPVVSILDSGDRGLVRGTTSGRAAIVSRGEQ
jgi:hypothetical protein